MRGLLAAALLALARPAAAQPDPFVAELLSRPAQAAYEPAASAPAAFEGWLAARGERALTNAGAFVLYLHWKLERLSWVGAGAPASTAAFAAPPPLPAPAARGLPGWLRPLRYWHPEDWEPALTGFDGRETGWAPATLHRTDLEEGGSGRAARRILRFLGADITAGEPQADELQRPYLASELGREGGELRLRLRPDRVGVAAGLSDRRRGLGVQGSYERLTDVPRALGWQDVVNPAYSALGGTPSDRWEGFVARGAFRGDDRFVARGSYERAERRLGDDRELRRDVSWGVAWDPPWPRLPPQLRYTVAPSALYLERVTEMDGVRSSDSGAGVQAELAVRLALQGLGLRWGDGARPRLEQLRAFLGGRATELSEAVLSAALELEASLTRELRAYGGGRLELRPRPAEAEPPVRVVPLAGVRLSL